MIEMSHLCLNLVSLNAYPIHSTLLSATFGIKCINIRGIFLSLLIWQARYRTSTHMHQIQVKILDIK